MDERIEELVRRLVNIDLEDLAPKSKEPAVAKRLAPSLFGIEPLTLRPGLGIDGSERNPDDARTFSDKGPKIDIAIEYKLYRDRDKGAGEMDRALGQCIAYAEMYDAVLFFVVYMGEPEHVIPSRWIDRSVPLRVGHKTPGVPVYFAARPRSWNEPWSSRFQR